MLSIHILNNEEMQGTIKKFISALLPHESYDSSFFSETLQVVFRYIRLEEFEMEYYLLLKALQSLNELKYSFNDYTPLLTAERFESFLEVSITSAVMRPELGVKEWLLFEALDLNLENPRDKEVICQKVCQRCLDLYDECFEMAIPSNEVMNYCPELKATFESTMQIQTINTQAAISNGRVRIGRRYYSGFDDWKEYSMYALSEIENRLSDITDASTTVFDSMETAVSTLGNLHDMLTPIANWNIPPLDDSTPILRHRLVVVVGNENVGKTRFVIDKTVNILLAGGKVVYMVGESPQAVIYKDILISYIWKKYGIVLQDRHILAPEECPEEIAKIINMSILEIVQNGNLILRESFTYSNVYQELAELYNATHFDAVIIDHSCALRGSYDDGSLYSNVTHLSNSLRDFRKDYPVSVIVTSHLSSYAKDLRARGRIPDTSLTKGSNDLQADADELFYLDTDELLRKQKIIVLYNIKRRGADKITQKIFLRTKYEVSGIIYDEELQANDNAMSIQKEEALASIEQDLDETEYTL